MANNRPKYNWETLHDTVSGIMTHIFTERVQVKCNIKKGEILVLVDGNTVNTYYNMTLTDYEALLLGVEEYAYELQRKGKIKHFWCKVAVYILMAVGMLAFMALAGDNDELSLGAFAAQKACCFGVIACCYLSVKHTPALAKAWRSIDNSIKE